MSCTRSKARSQSIRYGVSADLITEFRILQLHRKRKKMDGAMVDNIRVPITADHITYTVSTLHDQGAPIKGSVKLVNFDLYLRRPSTSAVVYYEINADTIPSHTATTITLKDDDDTYVVEFHQGDPKFGQFWERIQHLIACASTGVTLSVSDSARSSSLSPSTPPPSSPPSTASTGSRPLPSTGSEESDPPSEPVSSPPSLEDRNDHKVKEEAGGDEASPSKEESPSPPIKKPKADLLNQH